MDRVIENINLLQHYDRRECLHNINKNEALSTDSRPINQNSSNIYCCTDEEEAPTDLLYDTDDVYTAVDLDWRRGESYNQNYTHDFTDTDYTHDDGNPVQDYWGTSASTINENAYGYASTTTTASAGKHLPAIPVLQNGRVKGAYDEEGMYARRGNRFGVRLPAPPMDNSRYRLLPQAVAYKSSPHSDLNGHVGSAPHVGPLDERIGSFICLSATATRLLPQPQQHPHQHQQRLYGDDNSIESDFRPGISNRDFDASSCQMDRPFTSMLPLEYTDYSDYGFNSDNLSAYSDTPPMSNTQHKLQQQRKISLMMAMTTASVIASGETRVPIQRNANYPSAQISDRDSIVHFVSEKWSLPPAIPATPPATTRKLPKRLPSPQYKTQACTTATLTTTANTVVSAKNLNLISLPSKTPSEKSYRTKQLPKLPIAKSTLNSNLNTVFNLDMTSNTISDLSTNETSNANMALVSDNKITQLPSDTTLYCDHDNTKPPVYSDVANNFKEIAAEEEHSFKNYASSVDKLHSWPTTKTSPPPHSSSFVSEYLKNLECPIEEVKELDRLSSSEIAVKLEKELQVTESSSFDLSEYLKPYALDSSKFCTVNKLDYIPAITTQSTTSSITSTKENEPTNLLTSLDPHWPYSKDPINIDTDTKSSIISRDSASVAVVSTPSNDSFSSVSKMISKPIDLISSSIFAEDNKKSVSDRITEPVSNFSNVFTTTNLATCLSTASADKSNSITAATATTTSTETSITFQSTPSLSYIDYMKKFELPELPPIPDISPAVILDLVPDTGVCADTTIDTVSGNMSSIAYMAKTTEAQTVTENCSDKFFITSYSDIGNITSISSLPSLDENIPVEKPLPIYQYIENANDIENKLSGLPLDEDLNKTAVVLAERPVSPVSTTVAFDDSFYDSFNVDLSALTATMAHVDSETMLTPEIRQNSDSTHTQHEENATELNQITISGLDNEPEKYYKPQPQPSASNNIPSSSLIETPLRPKATSSVLGGLSKGLIGGLDGVLGGVGSSSQLVSSGNSNKKSFSFNLASKLVPSVGGLLSSGNKPPLTTAAETTTSTVKSSFEAEDIASKNTAFGYGYVYEYNPETVDSKMSTIDYPISHLRELHTDDSSYGVDTFPDLKSTPQHYECLIDNSLGNDEPVYSDDSRMEGVGYEEEFGYSDAPGNIHLINKTHGDIGTSIKEPYKTVADTITMESQPPLVAKTSGMFGSIFGKAAAAVQSATHAVNQSASSVASAVSQKATIIPGSGSKVSNPAPGVVFSPPNKAACGNESTEIYQGTMDNDYNDLAHNEEPLRGPYFVGGDDYENSNTHLSLDYSLDNDNETYAVYYSDRNHSRSDIVPTIPDEQQLLSTMLPAGSSGKKLPTINGKSGMLIKQQPTEIYDNETRQEDDGAAIIEEDLSGYHIDHERNDYYLNHQQATKSSLGGGAEAYYEHVGTGYDYREDFFNEEDEYKYLEQQRRQQITQTQSSRDYMDDRHDDDDDVEFSDANYPSDEDCGNYLDESSSGSIPVILPKGQGATSVAATCSSMTPVVVSLADQGEASISLQLASAHQQIKKQDSIIIEEEDDFHDQLSPGQVTDEADQLADLESIQSKTLKKKKILMRGETEEVVGGHMQVLRKPEITAKQRWHWAYNKIIIQINVSTLIH